MGYTDTGAEISSCGKYRYKLWREWPGFGPVSDGMKMHCAFVMLNPSTADGEEDDPTIRRCVGFSKAWGYDRLEVVNLFAYRATDPNTLLRLGHNDDPVGPENLEAFKAVCNTVNCGAIIVAWGAHGGHLGQDETALGWIKKSDRVHALGLTKDGKPRHPLYMKADCEPFRFPVARARLEKEIAND
jgi:hypothetical protein